MNQESRQWQDTWLARQFRLGHLLQDKPEEQPVQRGSSGALNWWEVGVERDELG